MDPEVVEATTSNIISAGQPEVVLDWLVKFSPLITLVFVVIGFFIYLGSIKQRFLSLEKDVRKILSAVGGLNECVNEMQSSLRAKFRTLTFTKETISIYGEENSPIVLKEKFKPLVKKSGLEREIEDNKSKLTKWLESKKPETGLDAQNYIYEFVVSGEINKYIDTTTFKEYLYRNGKSSQDYEAILGVYLFEKIIPEVVDKEAVNQ